MFAQYRAFIGPAMRQASSAYFYNWSGINLGGSLSPIGAYTLASSINDISTSIDVTGGAAFASAGGVWVGPNGAGQTWEHIAYASRSSSVLGTLQRIADDEVNTSHTAGAVVHFWYPLSLLAFQIDASLDDNDASIYWSASMNGVNMPRGAIRNNHICVVQYRTTPVAAWQNYIVGWLATPDVSDDSGRAAEWNCKILSSADVAAMQEVDRLRIGERNAARDGSANALSALSVPYKERYSGDYSASEPDLSASATRDGDASTPWISEHVVGTPLGSNRSNDNLQQGDIIITQLHISKAPGEPNGYRWIELTIMDPGNQPDMLLISGSGGYAGLDVSGTHEVGTKVILCEDDVLFQRQNPLAEGVILDLDDSTFFNTLNPDGDSLGLWFDTDLNDGWLSLVKWGSGASNPSAGEDKEDPPTWVGTTAVAPTNGRTLRYNWANSSTHANNWSTDYNDHAGYVYSVHPVDDGVWLSLELPGMGLKLKGDLSSGYTGVITIEDDSGPTTGGLADSGILQIGDEQIPYNGRTDTTVNLTSRGYGSTAAASHSAGDRVLILDAGVATDAVPINKIVWRRRADAANYPVDFDVKRSNLLAPRDPGDSNYNADYETFLEITGHAATEYVRPLMTTRRMKKVLLFIKKMLLNPSRARVDEFEAYLDPAFYDDAWLDNGQSAASIFERLLLGAQIPAGAISVTDDGEHDLSDFETEKGRAWRIIADLADYAGYMVKVAPDSKVTCIPNTFFISSSPSPSKTWNRVTARQARALLSNDGANSISQLSLKWETADKGESGTEVYPAAPDWRGSIVEAGPIVHADATEAQAAARKRYYMARIPYSFVIEATLGDPTIMPGAHHQLEWQFGHDEHGPVDRRCVVKAVSHRFHDMQCETSVTLLQTDREIAN